MNATAAQTKSLEWLNRLRANPKIPLIVAGSAAVAVMVALILWAKAPDYRTLFSNLSDQDGGAIVSQLTQMNIPYRFSEASGAIEAILSPIVGNGNIHAQVTAQLDFASKEQTEEQYRPNGDESHAALRSRQLNESEQSGSGYPGGVPGRCRINRHLRITRQSARLRQIKITASSRRAPPAIAGRVAHSGMKPVTTKSIAPFVIPK